MKNLSSFPLALQLLMQTDGTVTEFIKILAKEDVRVVKQSEQIIKDHNQADVLYRHIYLQGVKSGINWLYAESKIHLSRLADDFVNDLLKKSIPIGTLWENYRIETFKQLSSQYMQHAQEADDIPFKKGTELVCRNYKVYNNQQLIMEITEKFPIQEYKQHIQDL
jgi:chorismate-pyruvate lyase